MKNILVLVLILFLHLPLANAGEPTVGSQNPPGPQSTPLKWRLPFGAGVYLNSPDPSVDRGEWIHQFGESPMFQITIMHAMDFVASSQLFVGLRGDWGRSVEKNEGSQLLIQRQFLSVLLGFEFNLWFLPQINFLPFLTYPVLGKQVTSLKTSAMKHDVDELPKSKLPILGLMISTRQFGAVKPFLSTEISTGAAINFGAIYEF